METYDVTLTIGHNVGSVCKHDYSHVVAITANALQRIGVDGFTSYRCMGMWRGQVERSTRIEVYALTPAQRDGVLETVPIIAAALQQEAIAVTVNPSTAQFIGSADADAASNPEA